MSGFDPYWLALARTRRRAGAKSGCSGRLRQALFCAQRNFGRRSAAGPGRIQRALAASARRTALAACRPRSAPARRSALEPWPLGGRKRSDRRGCRPAKRMANGYSFGFADRSRPRSVRRAGRRGRPHHGGGAFSIRVVGMVAAICHAARRARRKTALHGADLQWRGGMDASPRGGCGHARRVPSTPDDRQGFGSRGGAGFRPDSETSPRGAWIRCGRRRERLATGPTRRRTRPLLAEGIASACRETALSAENWSTPGFRRVEPARASGMSICSAVPVRSERPHPSVDAIAAQGVRQRAGEVRNDDGRDQQGAGEMHDEQFVRQVLVPCGQ